MARQRVIVHYTRIYTDSDGESHFEDVNAQLAEADFAPPAPPLAVSSFLAATQFGFVAAPSGWYGDWHPTPRRQVFFVLSGQLEATVSDGEVRRLRAGDVLLVEDTAGKGHVSRTIGAADVITAVVQLPD